MGVVMVFGRDTLFSCVENNQQDRQRHGKGNNFKPTRLLLPLSSGQDDDTTPNQRGRNDDCVDHAEHQGHRIHIVIDGITKAVAVHDLSCEF
jgi:hypothetical protein